MKPEFTAINIPTAERDIEKGNFDIENQTFKILIKRKLSLFLKVFV